MVPPAWSAAWFPVLGAGADHGFRRSAAGVSATSGIGSRCPLRPAPGDLPELRGASGGCAGRFRLAQRLQQPGFDIVGDLLLLFPDRLYNRDHGLWCRERQGLTCGCSAVRGFFRSRQKETSGAGAAGAWADGRRLWVFSWLFAVVLVCFFFLRFRRYRLLLHRRRLCFSAGVDGVVRLFVLRLAWLRWELAIRFSTRAVLLLRLVGIFSFPSVV